MEGFTTEGKAVGIVLDVSLRHDLQGLRLVDVIKENLINMVKNSFEDDLDILYLYHPEVVDPVRKHGEQFYVIGSYETDGWPFNLTLALKQTLYTLAMEDIDLRKYLILITDRVVDCNPIEKILFINKKDQIDAHFVFVGIGNLYNRDILGSLGQDAVTYIHLDHPSQLSSQLIKETKNGAENLCCATNE